MQPQPIGRAPTADRRARAAVAAAFATQGLLFISLTTRLPRIADRWDLTEVDLSLLLLMVVLLAGVGSVGAEVASHRRDSASTLRIGLALLALGLVVLIPAFSQALFVAGLAVYGIGLGVVDAGTNMQAVALEHRYARPILPSFHGAWTFGGLVGAALALGFAQLPLGATAVVAVVPVAVLFAPFLPRARAAEVSASGPVGVPWRLIMPVGLGMVLFYMVDTAAQTWGPTYLDKTLDSPADLVALATLPYLLSSLVVRVAGDRLVARFGAVAVLRWGAALGCVALVVVVVAPTWPVAVVGFALLGAGVSVIAPLSFSAAARLAGGDPARRDAVIARFNQFNYLGALLGAVLTGLAGAGTLRVGFAVPMALILLMIPLARAFAPAGPALGASTPLVASRPGDA